MAPLRKALGLLILMYFRPCPGTVTTNVQTMSKTTNRLQRVMAIIEAAKTAPKQATISKRLELECIAIAVLLNVPFISAKKLCNYYIPDGKKYLALKDYEGSHFAIGTEMKNWKDAREACKKIDGDLVSTTTEEKWSHIFEELERVDGSHNHWLGAKSMLPNLDWQWVSGGNWFLVFKAHTPWAAGMPNGVKVDGGLSSEACLLSIQTRRHAYHENNNWWDYDCKRKFRYICEY